MKNSTIERVSKFEIDFTKLKQMPAKKKVRFYKVMLERILNDRTTNESVKLNCEGTIYELDGENVSIFMQCYEEHKKALEEVRKIKDGTPTCSINFEKIKDYTLEKKIVYFQNLMKRIENAPIGTQCTLENDGRTVTINKKDYKTYKACKRELTNCKNRLALIIGIKKKIAECKNSALAFKDRLVKRATRTREKTQEVVSAIRDTAPSSVKRGVSFALSVGFVGNMALEVLNDEVKINRYALSNLKPIELVREERKPDMEVHTIEVGDKVVVLDENPDILVDVVPINVHDEDELIDFLEESSIQYTTMPKDEFPGNKRIVIQEDEPQIDPKEQRATLIDSYFEEYCLYFNLDKDRVIEIARNVTNDYEVDFSSVIANILGNNKYNLTNDEAGVLAFTYLVTRDAFKKFLKEFGTSKNELKISNEVVNGGRAKGTEVILRTGETENQFMVRICKLLGVDETYRMAISMYETHDKEAGPFQSVMCRNKNNYGGDRAKSGEFLTYPSSEAGIIAACMVLKGYENLELRSLEDLSKIYVMGSRKAEPSELWVKSVRWFHKKIVENYEEYTGYPEEQEIEKVPVLELY